MIQCVFTPQTCSIIYDWLQSVFIPHTCSQIYYDTVCVFTPQTRSIIYDWLQSVFIPNTCTVESVMIECVFTNLLNQSWLITVCVHTQYLHSGICYDTVCVFTPQTCSIIHDWLQSVFIPNTCTVESVMIQCVFTNLLNHTWLITFCVHTQYLHSGICYDTVCVQRTSFICCDTARHGALSGQISGCQITWHLAMNTILMVNYIQEVFGSNIGLETGHPGYSC
jgi:uncharacterized protein YqcC (DUF446 family)